MLKSCSKCGRIHPYGFDCMPREYAQTEERKLRSSRKWTNKAKQIKNEAKGLCEVCRDNGIYNYKGLEVHHIIKIKDDPERLLDNDNLICLCSYHHKQADAGELTIDYLRELVERRQNE